MWTRIGERFGASWCLPGRYPGAQSQPVDNHSGLFLPIVGSSSAAAQCNQASQVGMLPVSQAHVHDRQTLSLARYWAEVTAHPAPWPCVAQGGDPVAGVHPALTPPSPAWPFAISLFPYSQRDQACDAGGAACVSVAVARVRASLSCTNMKFLHHLYSQSGVNRRTLAVMSARAPNSVSETLQIALTRAPEQGCPDARARSTSTGPCA